MHYDALLHGSYLALLTTKSAALGSSHEGLPLMGCMALYGTVWHIHMHSIHCWWSIPMIVGWNGLSHALTALTPIFLASSDFISPFSLANLPLVCWLIFQLANLSTCSVYCWGCHPRSLLVHWTHTVLSAPCWQNISVFCLLLRLPVHFCKQMSLLGNNFMKQLGEHIIHIIYVWNISTNPLFLVVVFYNLVSAYFCYDPPVSPRWRQAGASPKRCRRWSMKSRRLVKRPRVGISSLKIGILTTKSW